MDLDVAIAFTEAAFRSGRCRRLPWYGDEDQGWARHKEPNPGSAVHVYAPEHPVSCGYCKERMWGRHMKGHLDGGCPLHPRLMGTKPALWWVAEHHVGPEIRYIPPVEVPAPWEDEEGEAAPRKDRHRSIKGHEACCLYGTFDDEPCWGEMAWTYMPGKGAVWFCEGHEDVILEEGIYKDKKLREMSYLELRAREARKELLRVIRESMRR